MSLDPFWAVIADQIRELQTAKTATEVVEILSLDRNPAGPESAAGDAFFAGSGGDDTVMGALREAGWRVTWAEAGYYYVMTAPDGSQITYIEGDIYLGDQH